MVTPPDDDTVGATPDGAAPADGEPTPDGRTARRERNQEQVLDAVLDLFGEGETHPTPDEVARRSGVSLRSVYRYFDDSESLLRAAMARHLGRLEPLFHLDVVADDPLADRITALVDQRLRLYGAAAAVMRAATSRAARNQLIGARVEERRRLLRRQVEDLFAPELAAQGASGASTAAAADVLTSFEALDQLHGQRGLTPDATRRVLTDTLGRLLAAG